MKVSDQYELPLLGTLPLDPAVPLSGDRGTPIVVEDPKSPSTLVFR